MRFQSGLLTSLAIGVGVAVMSLAWARSAGTQAEPVSWSPDLHLKTREDIPHRLHEPVLERAERLKFTNGKAEIEVATCDEYLNAVRTGFFPTTNYENKMSGAFVHNCFVLRDLPRAQPVSSGGHYQWTAASLAQLPPMLVAGAREVTDAAEQAEKRGESWKRFAPSLTLQEISGDSLFAEDEDTSYFLTIVARGDFTGEGLEDIAVYATADGKHSSWAHAEYMILSPSKDGKLARLTDDRPPFGLKIRIPD